MRFALFVFIVMILCWSPTISLWAQTLNYGEIEKPTTLDPITVKKMVDRRIGQLLYDGLINPVLTLGATGEEKLSYERGLAADAKRTGLNNEFTLSENLRWSDGEEVTTRDVISTIRVMNNSRTDFRMPMWSHYVAANRCRARGNQILIPMRQHFYDPTSLLSFSIIPASRMEIMPETYLDEKSEFRWKPIGTGPFKLTGISDGGLEYEFQANERYRHRGKPYIKNVHLKTYDDLDVIADVLRRGKVDLVSELAPYDVARFEDQGKFKIQRYNSQTFYFLAYNMRETNPHHELFRDADFRRGVTYAIDRELALKEFYKAASEEYRPGPDDVPIPTNPKAGLAHEVVSGPLTQDSWAYNEAVTPYEYDQARGKELVAQAMKRHGYQRFPEGAESFWGKNGTPLVLKISYVRTTLNTDTFISYLIHCFKTVGIKLEKKGVMDSVLQEEVYTRHNYDIAYLKYSTDDTINIDPLFDCSRDADGHIALSNVSGCPDPETAAILQSYFLAFRNSVTGAGGQKAIHAIHEYAHEQCFHTYLWQLDNYACYNTDKVDADTVTIHPYYLFNQVENWKMQTE
jgi:ABC-type transport system substrate-binding protein